MGIRYINLVSWPFVTLPTRARTSAMNTLPLAQESQLTALEIELAKVQEQLQQSKQQVQHLQFDLSLEQSKRTELQMQLESKEQEITTICMRSINISNKAVRTSRKNEALREENAELLEENEKLRALGLQHLLERNELRREVEKITTTAKNENAINKQVIGASIETLEKVRQVAQQQNAKIEVIAEKAKKFDWLAKHYKRLFNKRI